MPIPNQGAEPGHFLTPASLPYPANAIFGPDRFTFPPAAVVPRRVGMRNPWFRGRVTLPNPVIQGFPAATVVGYRGTRVSQALRRPQVGRTVPAPHVAKPIVAPGGPVPVPRVVPVVVIRGAQVRGFYPRPAPRAHLAAANLAPPRFAPTVMVGQTVQRSFRRPSPGPHLAKPIVAPGGPKLVTSSQGVRVRSPRPTLTPRPHLAPPVPAAIASTPPVARGTYTFVRGKGRNGRITLPNPVIQGFPPVIGSRFYGLAAAALRARPPRTPAPHLAPRTLTAGAAAQPPVPTGTFKYVRIKPFGGSIRISAPVLSTAAAAPPVPVGRFVYQRGRGGRGLIRLAKPIVAPGKPFVGSKAFGARGRGRFFTGKTRVAPPNLTPAPGTIPPLAPAVIVSQVQRRGTLQRSVPKPHLSPANLAPKPFPPAKIVRVRIKPFGGRTRLAPPVVTQQAFPPVAAGSFVNQTTKRSTLQRTVPKPHLARGIIAPGAGFIGSKAFQKLQAIARALIGRFPPKPHTAPETPAAPIPDPNPVVITGRETAVSGVEDDGIRGREMANQSATEIAVTGRERNLWPM